jgi:Right handed beta helix region
MRRGAFAGIVAVVALGVTGSPAGAVTIKVETTADQLETGPGKCALREAVRAAQDDAPFGGCRAGSGKDKVELRAGKTYPLAPSPLPGAIGMPGEVTIRVKGKGRATVNASATDEGAFVADGLDNVLRDLVIRGGDSLIGGGGIHVTSGSSLTVFDSVVKRNRTDVLGGGGIYAGNGELRVVRTTVSGNTADGIPGGGISLNGGNLEVVRSTISGNEAVGGGGIHLASSSGLIENSTIAGNEASGSGGGLYIETGSMTLANATLSGNASDAQGGGTFAIGGTTLTARNSIVAGNAAPTPADGPDCRGDLALGYSLLGDDSGCSGFFPTPDNVIGEPARLRPLADNGGPTKTMALRPGSPARNAGNPNDPGTGGLACAATDQRGVQRPKGPRCDMGAFEG